MNMTKQRPQKRTILTCYEGLGQRVVPRGWSRLLWLGCGLLLAGCAGPALSSLEPKDVTPYGLPVVSQPKGDVYADEEFFHPKMTIAPGDTLEISLYAGAKLDPVTTVVGEDGVVSVPLLDTAVSGLTAQEAETRLQEELKTFYRNPRVQVHFKKKKVRVKRVIVVGEVNRPGVIPMARNMSVLSSLAEAGSYKEGALLEGIRIIRTHDETAEVLTADVARLLTYGDWSRTPALQENDIVFVPRSRYGKSAEFIRRVLPFVQVIAAPFVAVSSFKILVD
jgi:protein involved in polysaccharide export with SLBB domain